MRELDTVRVVGLDEPATEHLAIGFAQRAPRLGDIGTIIEIQPGTGTGHRYLVESITGEGETVWIAQFSEAELALEEEFERGR